MLFSSDVGKGLVVVRTGVLSSNSITLACMKMLCTTMSTSKRVTMSKAKSKAKSRAKSKAKSKANIRILCMSKSDRHTPPLLMSTVPYLLYLHMIVLLLLTSPNPSPGFSWKLHATNSLDSYQPTRPRVDLILPGEIFSFHPST